MTASKLGMKPVNFPGRRHGFDDIFEHNGSLVIVEAKGGSSRLGWSYPGGRKSQQMSRQWIENKITKLKNSFDPLEKDFGEKLQQQLDNAVSGRAPSLKGMLVTTEIDDVGDVLDPDFDLKDFSSIGLDRF